MTRNVIVCSSPTCAASINLGHIYSLATALRLRGWTREQQPGDDRALPYCSRCRS